METTEKILNQYNEFDGQAMITLDEDGLLECTVGQNECFVDGYTVIVSKNLKEDKELYLTFDELLDIFAIPSWKD